MPLLFVLLVSDLPNFINVLTLPFTNDAKLMSPRSQLYNAWKWSVYWDLPINPFKCKYIAIGRAPPLQFSFAPGCTGDPIQVTNVGKDLGVQMDRSFALSIHCREAASKAKRVLFMLRRSFAELSESAFSSLYNTLVRSHFEHTIQTCSLSSAYSVNAARLERSSFHSSTGS